ncbi:MAG: TOBE domain-containing protein, partial [Candidatus Enteromonas sp.]|nr:TOBE domain-containing protein [Candidatus Enteromonas sp.]
YALNLVDLEGFEKRAVSTLSGGQQQRIAIARAIVNEPEILLLDEPLGALDLKMRKEMQLELKAMHKKLGITFIYVTHDQEEALTMSDTIVVMSDGEIQQVGTPKEIYDEPKNAFVADFIGESSIFTGTVQKGNKIKFLGASFDSDPADEGKFALNEKVDVVIRPEDVIIGEPGNGNVDGKIASKLFQGVHYEYVVNVGKNEVICRDTKNREVGSKVSLSVEKENIQVMHKELSVNQYTDAWIDASGKLHIGEASFECDLGQLLPGAIVEDCRLTDPKSRLTYDLNDADVVAEVDLDKIDLSDDLSIGSDTGTIIASVWIGDHYRYIVRTEEEEDYVAVSPYSWNEGDQVSVTIKKEDIRLRLKNDIDTYKGKGE